MSRDNKDLSKGTKRNNLLPKGEIDFDFHENEVQPVETPDGGNWREKAGNITEVKIKIESNQSMRVKSSKANYKCRITFELQFKVKP